MKFDTAKSFSIQPAADEMNLAEVLFLTALVLREGRVIKRTRGSLAVQCDGYASWR